VINSTFVSLDGVVNRMDAWHFGYIDAESDALALEQLSASEAILMGRLVRQVTELKHQPGGDTLMHGYGPVARTLLEDGLLDELHLWIHPVLAGVGGRGDLLFHEGTGATFDLAGSRSLASGVVVLSYRAIT
jgi:dihydrofolate reductase